MLIPCFEIVEHWPSWDWHSGILHVQQLLSNTKPVSWLSKDLRYNSIHQPWDLLWRYFLRSFHSLALVSETNEQQDLDDVLIEELEMLEDRHVKCHVFFLGTTESIEYALAFGDTIWAFDYCSNPWSFNELRTALRLFFFVPFGLQVPRRETKNTQIILHPKSFRTCPPNLPWIFCTCGDYWCKTGRSGDREESMEDVGGLSRKSLIYKIKEATWPSRASGPSRNQRQQLQAWSLRPALWHGRVHAVPAPDFLDWLQMETCCILPYPQLISSC